jgi:hypothetical protein
VGWFLSSLFRSFQRIRPSPCVTFRNKMVVYYEGLLDAPPPNPQAIWILWVCPAFRWRDMNIQHSFLCVYW